jgi:integrase/recombinase XerD
MEQHLHAFLQYLQAEFNYSKNTIAAYKNDLGQFVKFLHKEHPDLHEWPAVTPEIVTNYVDYMKKQPYASSSVARKVAAVKSYFNYLKKNEIIPVNPTTDIDSPKVKKRLPKTLQANEVERLLAAPSKKYSPKNLRDAALLNVSTPRACVLQRLFHCNWMMSI